MSRLAYIGNRAAPLEVITYSIDSSINSIAPGDTTGLTSSASIIVKAQENGSLSNRYLSCVDQTITLVDSDGIEGTAFKGRGIWSGVISKASRAGARITFSVDSILTRLNVTKFADPFFGRARPDFITVPVVNAATNPSGETGTSNYGVSAGTSGTAAITNPTTTAFAGTKTVRATWSVAATSTGGLVYTQTGLTAGSFYTFSVQTRTDSSQALNMLVQWKNAGGTNIGTAILVGSGQSVPGTWSEIDGVGIFAPVGATQAAISIFNNATDTSYYDWGVGSYLELDGWMITIGSDVYPFADGSFPNATWNGTAGSSTSTISLTLPQDPGYDATWANAFRYYCGLVGIFGASINIDPYFEQIYVSYRGWEGNLLDHIKDMCAAEGAVVTVVNGIIQVNRPHSRHLRYENVDSINLSVSSQGATREVSVYNYNNQWLTDSVTVAPNNVYSIGNSTSSVFTLETDDSLTSVNNPVCVSAITPTPYTGGTGQYVVTDSNNHAVAPADWKAAGGSVTAELDATNPGTIIVSVHAPTFISKYVGPFRLAQVINGQDEPALYVTGTGVFSNQETVTLITGSPVNSARIKDVSAPVDNMFLGTLGQAHDRGTFAADQRGGVVVQGSGTIPFDPDSAGQEFGVIEGSRYYAYDGIYTITHATTSPAGVQFESNLDVSFDDLTDLFAMIFDEFNATYTGLTFSAFNTLQGSITFDQFNSVSANPTIDQFNTIYAGANFDDHAVYPYRREVAVDDIEARF